MDNENKFPEQDAPVKNTDNAFVKVGKDGAPQLPTEAQNGEEIPKDDESKASDNTNASH